MQSPQDNTNWSWLWLFPILLAAMIFEYGVINGIWRFASFVYVGSFVMFVGLWIAAFFSKVLLKREIIVTGLILVIYSLIELIRGNSEIIFKAAIFGVIVGTVFGVATAFVYSPAAAKISHAESTIYGRIGRWFREKK